MAASSLQGTWLALNRWGKSNEVHFSNTWTGMNEWGSNNAVIAGQTWRAMNRWGEGNERFVRRVCGDLNRSMKGCGRGSVHVPVYDLITEGEEIDEKVVRESVEKAGASWGTYGEKVMSILRTALDLLKKATKPEILIPVSIILGTTGILLLCLPMILPATGFGAAGITAGTLAAGSMSAFCGAFTSAGGVIATLTSMGMVGVPAGVMAMGAVGVVFAAVGAGVGLVGGRKKGEQEAEEGREMI